MTLTQEQIAERNRSKFYTLPRDNAEAWDCDDLAANAEEFLQRCGKAQYVLVRNRHWHPMIASNVFVNTLDLVTDHSKVLDGFLGYVMGAELHSDCFVDPTIRDAEDSVIYFIPRA